jgi:undecaprenyl-diphosphatase
MPAALFFLALYAAILCRESRRVPDDEAAPFVGRVKQFVRSHLPQLCLLSSVGVLFEMWESVVEPGGVRGEAAELAVCGILLSLLFVVAAAALDGIIALDPERTWSDTHRKTAMERSFGLAALCFIGFLGINALTRLPEVQGADAALSHAVYRSGGDIVTNVMKRVSDAGGDDMTLIGLPLLAIGLMLLRRAGTLRFLAGVMLGVAGITTAAKALLPRLRPDLVNHRNLDSFPSGHTLSATVLAGVLFLALAPLAKSTWQRVLLWAAAIFWPLLMAASRVYLGRHYLTDVLAGLLLGASWALFCRGVLVLCVQLGLDRRSEAVALST